MTAEHFARGGSETSVDREDPVQWQWCRDFAT